MKSSLIYFFAFCFAVGNVFFFCIRFCVALVYAEILISLRVAGAGGVSFSVLVNAGCWYYGARRPTRVMKQRLLPPRGTECACAKELKF